MGRSLGHVAREVEATAGELLRKDAEAGAIPEQDTHLIAASIPKDEQVATERIGPEALRDEHRKAIEALAEIGRLGRHIDMHRRRQGQHATSPSVPVTASTRS